MERIHADPTRRTGSGIREGVSPALRGAKATASIPSVFGDARAKTVHRRIDPAPKAVPTAPETTSRMCWRAAIASGTGENRGGHRARVA